MLLMWVKQLRLMLVGKIEKVAKRLTTPKSQVANVVVPQIANVLVPPEEITKKVNEVIAKYADTSAINLNKLID